MPKVTVPAANYVVQYNGFVFDGATTETVGITSQAHYDEAGRTIAYLEYTIHIRTIIYSTGAGVNTTQMNNIRRMLQSPGGQFLYVDRGFGQFRINSFLGRQRDVKWGPKPQVLSWKPWGDANAAEVEWQVMVCIPECDAAKFENHAMEYNFAITYERDADGFTTRKISGYLTIPQTRFGQGNRRFRRSADDYRETITPRVPVGFRPLAATFKLSYDKCRLDFEFADEEMGNEIPPPGVIRVKGEMTAQNTKPLDLQNFTYTLSATYDMARGFNPDIAKLHFINMMNDRRKVATDAANAERQADALGIDLERFEVNENLIGKALITHWKVGEPVIFGKFKQCNFVCQWVNLFKLPQLMTAAFWRPVPHVGGGVDTEANWNRWAAPIGVINPGKDRMAFGPRGQAGLKFDPTDDLIIDLCQDDPKPQNILRKGPPRAVNPALKNKGKEKLPMPRVVEQWILYEQAFFWQRIDMPILHKPIVPPPRGGTSALIRVPTNENIDSLFPPPTPVPGASASDFFGWNVVRPRTQPTWYLWHTGRAMRLGAAIPPPTAVKIGILPLVPANTADCGFKCMVLPGNLGQNIHVATWKFRYTFATSVPPSPGAPNPTFDEKDKLDKLLRDADIQMREQQREWNARFPNGPSGMGPSRY